MIVSKGQAEPLTFATAPTYERDGRTYVEPEAVAELAVGVGARFADALRLLAD